MHALYSVAIILPGQTKFWGKHEKYLKPPLMNLEPLPGSIRILRVHLISYSYFALSYVRILLM